ncbi:Flp pilus assembly protein CpaB [Aliidiomarina sedimenti]|uniref:Flp pilus assembly protein CpaB n=1 Tax=Aliidiomarina sedimenti TaxID=1933879 RepID=A0ABY0C394_9GAMM|nr:Flp pilus assembly protein CpaB [Aliidiomarina sedimenti]RUO32108.1 Flp pilus assembly protein CpaB [Aliidiomarina sedimenti]
MKWKFNGSFWLPLCCGLAAAIAALYLLQLYLQRQLQQAPLPLDLPAEQLEVVVANRPLSTGSQLTPAWLSLRRVHAVGLANDHIRAEHAASVFGRLLEHPVAQGQPLQWLHLASQQQNRFSDLLLEGQRAFTLLPGTEQSHAGLLQLGDKVDLVALAERSLEVIESGVTVVAVDGQWEFSDSATERSVTLAISVEKMASVERAQRSGQLQLWLRSTEDSKPLSVARRQTQWIVGGRSEEADEWRGFEQSVGALPQRALTEGVWR